MKTTVYMCDKCRQAKQEHELAELRASLNIKSGFSSNSYSTQIQTKDVKHICKECLQSLGMFKEIKENDKLKPQPELEIKDRLFDVLHDMLQEMGVIFEN